MRTLSPHEIAVHGSNVWPAHNRCAMRWVGVGRAPSRPIFGPVQKTTNLAVAARAKRLAVSIYKLTATFPASERYGLTAQVRRAAVSIGSNIAEGCGRHGDRSLLAFLQIAMGSASELEFQLRIATDLNVASAEQSAPVLAELKQVTTMLIRLIQALRRSTPPSRSTARR